MNNNPPVVPIPVQEPPFPPQWEGTVKEVHLYEYLKLKPPTFTRESVGEDPMWFLEGTIKACQDLGCSSVRMVQLATYQLQRKADRWWKSWSMSRAPNSPPVKWDEFQRLFMEQFIPQSVRLAKAREFEALKQGSLSVEEHDTEFNRLCTYAPYMIPDEREKIKSFVFGLRRPIRQLVELQMEI